tara:strand:+ start:10619 stop:10810 length:192 start_codon:yes stop_codon:yes gene_type:complete
MTVTQEDGGRTNVFAKEPPMEVIKAEEVYGERAEKLNGRLAMLGVVAAIGSYATTGQLIPNIF